MSLREEQCNKVCRILDDVLANRPTERDSLIVAVRKAFEAEPHWIPATERMPEEKCIVLVTTGNTDEMSAFRWRGLWYCFGEGSDVMHNNPIAWYPLPAPFRPEAEKEE